MDNILIENWAAKDCTLAKFYKTSLRCRIDSNLDEAKVAVVIQFVVLIPLITSLFCFTD